MTTIPSSLKDRFAFSTSFVSHYGQAGIDAFFEALDARYVVGGWSDQLLQAIPSGQQVAGERLPGKIIDLATDGELHLGIEIDQGLEQHAVVCRYHALYGHCRWAMNVELEGRMLPPFIMPSGIANAGSTSLPSSIASSLFGK